SRSDPRRVYNQARCVRARQRKAIGILEKGTHCVSFKSSPRREELYISRVRSISLSRVANGCCCSSFLIGSPAPFLDQRQTTSDSNRTCHRRRSSWIGSEFILAPARSCASPTNRRM